MNFHLGREGEHGLMSFIRSSSAGTVRPQPGEAPATVSADCSGPACPERGLGEGGVGVGVSRPRRGLQAAGNAPSQLAPLSLHPQRLGMLQTQQ